MGLRALLAAVEVTAITRGDGFWDYDDRIAFDWTGLQPVRSFYEFGVY
jgi:hypothetical protein